MEAGILLYLLIAFQQFTSALEIQVIALTGSNNDAIQGVLAETDLEISIPANKETRILENHLFVINALCELVDSILFPRA